MIIFTFTVLFFLILRFAVTLFNFLSNPKLTAFQWKYDFPVSIVVILKNEESNLLGLLDSIAQQDYRYYEVFIYHSGMEAQDEQTVEQFCYRNPQFKTIQGNSNDYAWIEAAVKGRYLMLLDSNTQIHPGLIKSLIYRFRVFNLGLISVIPTREVRSFKQQFVFPLSDFMLLNMVPLRLVRLLKTPVLAPSCSDCLFLDAELCFLNQWMERLNPYKGTAELLKIVKQDRYKAEVLLGNNLIYKTSKEDDAEALTTAAESFCLYFNGNLLVGFLYVFLLVVGPMIILLGFDVNLLVLPLGLIFLSKVMIAFLTAQNPVIAVFSHPFQMIMLVVVYIKALRIQLLTRHKQNAK